MGELDPTHGSPALGYEEFALTVGALTSRVTRGQLHSEAREDGDAAGVVLRGLLGAYPDHTAQLIAEEARAEGHD